MVGPLQYFEQDPNGKGRGPGWYYHRGKGYYSKYEVGEDSREANIKAKHKARNPFYAHTGDGFRKLKPSYRTKALLSSKKVPPIGLQYKLDAKTPKPRKRRYSVDSNYDQNITINKKRGRKGRNQLR